MNIERLISRESTVILECCETIPLVLEDQTRLSKGIRLNNYAPAPKAYGAQR